MAPESKTSSRRRFWRILLLVLVVLPLLPEIVVLSVSAIADLSGCRVDAAPVDSAVSSQVSPDPWMVANGFAPAPQSVVAAPARACAIGPLPSVSTIIRLALEAGLLVGVSFGSGVVVVWLALCYVAITRGWTDLLSQLTLAFLVSLIFSFVPYFGPMMSIGHLDNPHCQPNEGGVGPCMMYGGDVGSIVHENVVLGWHVFIGAPVALGEFGAYLLFLLISGFFVLKRVSPRRHKAKTLRRSNPPP